MSYSVGVQLLVFGGALLWALNVRLGKRLRRKAIGSRKRNMLAVMAILGTQLVFFAPAAHAANCGDAPIPERPGAGMVGAIDPPALDRGDPVKSYYGQYSYAGTVWHVYDNNCVLSKGITDPNATIDTWAGNELFNVGKNVVGATNSLHYAMLSQDSMLKPLDDAVLKASETFYNNIYVRWFSLAAIILAILLFRYIWMGDLAAIGRRSMWALGGMWLAASVLAIGPVYAQVDNLLLQKTSQIQAGFLSSDATAAQRDALPDSLYDNVIYKNWLRGEFGDPNSAMAQRYGPQLLDAQAWKKTDVNSADDSSKIAAKQAVYKAMPSQLGSSSGFFEGTDGSRTGSGFLAAFQGIAYGIFPLLAKAGVLLAQVLIRILVLGAPLIGLVGMVLPEVLRKVMRTAAAVGLTVLMLSAMAGMHALLLNLIFGAGDQLSLLAQMILATLITIIFLMVGKPIRRMKQMVELAAGGSGLNSAGGGSWLAWMRRNKDNSGSSPQESFWQNVRTAEGGGELGAASSSGVLAGLLGGKRLRPEGVGPVQATAVRTDRRGGQSPVTQLMAQGQRAPLGLGAGNSGSIEQQGRATFATGLPKPEQQSRIVDTSPISDDSRWDRHQEGVVLPSEILPADQVDRGFFATPSQLTGSMPTPRKAETEVVGGKPVFVVYRPSRGLEVRDTRDTDNFFEGNAPRRT